MQTSYFLGVQLKLLSDVDKLGDFLDVIYIYIDLLLNLKLFL